MKSLKNGKIVFFSLLIVILFGHGICNRQVQTIRKDLPAENLRAEALMVNPNLLRIIGGEFKGLLADYVLLKASVWLGGTWEMTPDDWQAMAMLLEQSLVLDPYFFQTGYYTQGILAWRKGMAGKAVELLEFQAEHRDWDWELKFYIGFDYFYLLKDNVKATKIMMEAAKLPGSPPIVATLGARLAQRSGQTLTAIAMLRALYENTENEKDKLMLGKRLQAHIGIYMIEQALSEYSKRYERRPTSLEELIRTNIIKEMPINPYGKTFLYNPADGNVFFDEIQK